MPKITIEEFNKLKSEFDEIYLLLQAEADVNNTEKLLFSDGTDYSEEEAIERMRVLNDKLLSYDLSDIPADYYGRMIIFTTGMFKGLANTGANIDFSLLEEDWENIVLADVRGCNLINLDFDKIYVSDRVVDEKIIEENKEHFLDRPSDKDDPKNEALDRYYERNMSDDDVILLRKDLVDKTKKIKFGYRHRDIIEALGVERFIELINREPVYMKSFILEHYNYKKYLDIVNDEMDVDSIIDTWFEITKKEIEKKGIHSLTKNRNIPLRAELVDIDVNLYGENFIKAYPQFFVEDRNLPEEIKKKFYNGKLSFEEFFQYQDEFEGIMIGIGIGGVTEKIFLDLEVFNKLIEEDPVALDYIIRTNKYSLYNNQMLKKGNSKEEFAKVVAETINSCKIAIYNKDIKFEEVFEDRFYRERIPDLFLDASAPMDLQAAYYNMTLSIDDLANNPGWIPWLEGNKEYVKKACIRTTGYEKWAGTLESFTNIPDEVNEFLVSIFNDEIRRDRKKGIYRRESLFAGSFKENNPDLFFDDLPDDLRKLFEERSLTIKDIFDLPEDKKGLLKEKEISMLLSRYSSEFEFCQKVSGRYEAFEAYEKYRTVMFLIMGAIQGYKVENVDEYVKNGEFEELLKKATLYSIENEKKGYNDRVPDDFKAEHPELFLSQDDFDFLSHEMEEEQISEIKDRFYAQKIDFDFLKKYPQLKDLVKNKNLKAVLDENCIYLWDICEGDIEVFFDVAIEYGNILIQPEVRKKIEKNEHKVENDKSFNYIDEILLECINEKNLSGRERLTDSFKYKHPEFFLFPEELASLVDIESEDLELLKRCFYEGRVDFQTLKDYPQFKEIIKSKNMKVCMQGLESVFIDRFTEELDGNRDKAINLASGRFATQLDKLIGNEGFNSYENIDKIIAYYKEMKFIPNPAVVRKFPIGRVKDFALNSKLWGKLMAMPEYNSSSDYIGSMLEAAMVMGMFETKEFVKSGEVRVQGSGQEGFERLQELLNKSLKYYRNPSESLKEEGKVEFVGKGYIKTSPDYEDELIFYNLQRAALDFDLSDELVQGGLLALDIGMIVARTGYEDSSKLNKYFEPTGEDGYRCNIDTKLSQKIGVLFETLGIKDSSVLSEDEFRKLKSYNGDHILSAFKKTTEGYRFNMAKIGESYVIDGNQDIDEKESKENQRLFNYIKFLMMEYGLDIEGGMLAANNDRSNINLVLAEEKIEKILSAADALSEKAQEKYSFEELWIPKGDFKPRIFTADVLHKVFDGMKMEYNEAFANFLLEYGDVIASDHELLARINVIQRTVVKISKDDDLNEKKITPELVIHMMGTPNYDNAKVGFEKGLELAQKFYFTQEEFEEAQEIWDEARKREASSIPRIEKKEEEYSYEVLRLDDAVGIFVGNITECCQKVGGVGETAMLHSMKEKNGRVFVVRDANNKIIAQAWLWRNGNTVCFDNVEIPHKAEHIQKNQEIIYEVLKKAAKEICEKDSEVLDSLVAEGKIDKDKAEKMKAKKVTVGKGNTDLHIISHNSDKGLEDEESKYPLESDKKYNGKRLYTDDSRSQVILYKAEDYEEGLDVPTLAIHRDENLEKPIEEISLSEIKAIGAIECEFDPEVKEKFSELHNYVDLAKIYNLEPDELKIVKGTDWFMIYSENEESIEVHKMLRSPSSGIMKKSVREQKEAVKMIMDKAVEFHKTISMDIDNDKVFEAMRTMLKHTRKNYEMTIQEAENDKGNRIEISGVEGR